VDPLHWTQDAALQSWARYIEQIRLDTHLTAEERDMAEAAILTLAELLGGDAWLANAFFLKHPLIYYLWNKAPWSHKMLIRMATAVDALKECPKFAGLKDRFGRADKFAEAQDVLDVAYNLHLVGFDVCFDPNITIQRKDGSLHSKMPDLMITDAEAREGVFVEISALTFNEQHAQITYTSNILFERLMELIQDTRIMARARFHKTLDTNNLKRCFELIDNLFAKVRASGEFESFEMEGLVEIGAAPEERASIVDEWASQQGIELNQIVSGPPIDLTKELKRLARDKIGKKIKQLPHDRPGFIIVTTDRNLLFYNSRIDEIAAELSEQLQYRNQQLLCAVVSHRHYAEEKDTETHIISTMDYSVIDRSIADVLKETSVLVPNKACVHPSSASIIAKIHRALSIPG
jgi:hypothetical protein